MVDLRRIDSRWPKAIHERYFCRELSSIGKWKLISSMLALKNYARTLNVYLNPNGLSKWINNCDEIYFEDVFEKKYNETYDLIVMYDLIDHLDDESQVVYLLEKCRDFLKRKGKIFLLCHPGISRIGTHLFDVNKAYIHLFCDTQGKKTLLIENPIEFYRECFRKSMLKAKEERIYKEYIEDFFDDLPEEIRSKANLGTNHEIQFVSYILTKEIKLL